jgi:hypothetical protein
MNELHFITIMIKTYTPRKKRGGGPPKKEGRHIHLKVAAVHEPILASKMGQTAVIELGLTITHFLAVEARNGSLSAQELLNRFNVNLSGFEVRSSSN